jgi:hypothetical protein
LWSSALCSWRNLENPQAGLSSGKPLPRR